MSWFERLVRGEGAVPGGNQDRPKRDFGLLPDAEQVIAELDGNDSGTPTEPASPAQESND